jgi:hypothetical protein
LNTGNNCGLTWPVTIITRVLVLHTSATTIEYPTANRPELGQNLDSFHFTFTAMTTFRHRHQPPLLHIKLLLGHDFPLVVALKTQGLTLLIPRRLGFFKGQDVSH